jgi:hypothetical protein
MLRLGSPLGKSGLWTLAGLPCLARNKVSQHGECLHRRLLIVANEAVKEGQWLGPAVKRHLSLSGLRGLGMLPDRLALHAQRGGVFKKKNRGFQKETAV